MSGKTEMGAPIAESFQRDDAGAKWKSLADEGRTDSCAATLYVPLNYTFETLSQMVRALTNSPERKLPGLPVGTVTIERLQEEDLINDGVRCTVALYALTGLDYSPTYVWMSEKPDSGCSPSSIQDSCRQLKLAGSHKATNWKACKVASRRVLGN